ncbi:hypothetical protein QTN25_007125 [Entamoeba marina]
MSSKKLYKAKNKALELEYGIQKKLNKLDSYNYNNQHQLPVQQYPQQPIPSSYPQQFPPPPAYPQQPTQPIFPPPPVPSYQPYTYQTPMTGATGYPLPPDNNTPIGGYYPNASGIYPPGSTYYGTTNYPNGGF